jgi:oligopeptide/dipeptide ABC transporter ATP-binding protein
VMYLGKIVEQTRSDDLFSHPRHPYTRALLSAVLSTEGDQDQIVLEGEVPSPMDIPSGCCFRTRCYKVQERCASVVPVLEEKTPNHWVACHFPESG